MHIMQPTTESVLKALAHVIEPDLKKDVISLELVSNIEIDDSNVKFTVQVNNPAMHSRKRMEEACIFHVQRLHGDVNVSVDVQPMSRPEELKRIVHNKTPLDGVKNIIAIASGKGGVGKSTITANLAVGLVKKGLKVGLVDADIYGPSIPLMFDVLREKPGVAKTDGKSLMTPVESYGVKILSIGFFAESNQAVAWRGPMASKAITQMTRDVLWGELDYLLVDLPPGTGDIHLTLVQNIPLTGAVVVSTPQPVALADARKGVAFFGMPNIDVPVLGLVENMSWFTPKELPESKYYIFGKDGAKNLAQELELPLLGQIPLVQSIRESGDVGRPAVLQEGTPQAQSFLSLTENLLACSVAVTE